ncbi:MAG: peptidylprolyl isomerase [Bacteroidales bacterium]|jgi:peptidyl-prolyl cis-trans isomerase SurA|nr:peptidylprolyl isomerase [Bacteroidales bacterium]
MLQTIFHIIRQTSLSALLLVASASMLHAQNDMTTLDEIIWVVGDYAILKSEVEEARSELMFYNEKFKGDPYCFIPEQIAVRKLFLNQAKVDSVEVTESEVSQSLDYQMNRYISLIGSKEKVEEYFRKPFVQIRENERENIRELLTVQAMQKKIVGEITVTPSEVRKYYAKLPADSLPFIPTQVELQIITFEPRPSLQAIDKVKANLRQFVDQINKGEMEFSTIAKLYSQDKESAKRGGELDYLSKSQLLPEFANVAFNLPDTKKISQIVETEAGFHIIQLVEKQGSKAKFRHILLKPEIDPTEIAKAITSLDSIAADIHAKKFTFEEAATALSGDKDSRNNNGLMVNPQTGTSRFEMQDLQGDIAKIVDKMEPGEISQAIATINQKTGKDICMIVKLKTRHTGHRANPSADYQELRDIVKSAKTQEVIQNWIRERQKTTYIRINPNWLNCDFEFSGWINTDE